MLGATAMAYLASRASTIYARSLQISFAFEQQRQAALAAKRGEWLLAAMAYHNIAAAETMWSKPFGVEDQEWKLLLPLAAPVLEQISQGADRDGKGKRLIAGIAHARYAFALEKSGLGEQAAPEWDKALRSAKFDSIETARTFAIKLLDQDIQFFSEH